MYPKILAIDTSSVTCSVALLNNETIDELNTEQDKQQSQVILALIDELLTRNQLNVADLDVLAYAHGPGSFTGLRVGASVIQGLSYSYRIPVIGISTLRMLAQGAYRASQVSTIFATLDARMKEVYWGVYKLNPALNIMECISEDSIAPNDQIAAPVEQTLLAKAQDLIPIALHEFQQQRFMQAHEAIPIYLRNNVATQPQL